MTTAPNVFDARGRLLEEATTATYDLLIVGGGITGAGIARDAAMRGLKTLLLEKGDFASGTSSRSGKLVHGGLRYLRYYHFGLVFESTNERYRLRKILAPHIVKPVKFVVPYYRSSHTPRWFVTIGLFLYGALSLFRNAGRFHVITREQLEAEEPGLYRYGSAGGLAYYDSQALDFRLVIDTLKSAAEHGATVLNYCEVQSVESNADGHRVTFTDRATGAALQAACKVVINAAGSWTGALQARLGSPQRFELSTTRGAHLIIDRHRLDIRHAVALESPIDHRNVYAIPWGAYALIGSTDARFEGDLDNVRVQQDEVDYLLGCINHYFRRARLTASDIRSSYASVRPLIGGHDEKVEAELSRDYEIRIDDNGIVAIAGGKLTTYRSMSSKLLNKVIRRFFAARKLRRCATISPISGGDLASVDIAALEARGRDLPAGLVDLLLQRYGSNAAAVLDRIEAADDGAQWVPGVDLVFGELDYFIAAEYARSVSDILMRRYPASIFAPGRGLAAAEAVGRRLALRLGWSEEQAAAQVASYRAALAQPVQPAPDPA